MSALAGIRAELAELYERRAKESADLDRVYKKLTAARTAFEAQQKPVMWCNDRIEALNAAWRSLTTDDVPGDPTSSNSGSDS